MPQLMPLNWCMSFLVVCFLFVMMSLIYFEGSKNLCVVNKEIENFMSDWEW